MGWPEVDSKVKERLEREFISCLEKRELDYVKSVITSIIMEEVPEIAEATIRAAIDECCCKLDAPRPRYQFMQCVREKLS